MRRLTIAAPLLGMALLFSGCARDLVTGERRFAVDEWSSEEELALGANVAPNIESMMGGVLPDARATEVLGKVVDEIIEESKRTDDFPWQFKIINTSQLNAFALPGGFVYVTRGLLSRMSSEGQFVFTLGHEVGHVEHRHAMLNSSRQKVAGALTSPLGVIDNVSNVLPKSAGGAVRLATSVARAPAALTLLSYGRGQETECDVRGAYFAHQLGYDPSAGAELFEIFLAEEKAAGATQLEWLRSHPLNETRIEDLREEISRKYPSAGPDGFRESSPEFLAVIQKYKDSSAVYELYDKAAKIIATPDAPAKEVEDARRCLEQAIAREPEEPLFSTGMGEVEAIKGNNDAARAHFVRAVELYEQRMPGSGYWKPHYYLGMIGLEAGELDFAAVHLESANRLFPQQPVIYFGLGTTYRKQGRKESATWAFKKVLRLTPRGSALHEAARKELDAL